MVNPALVRARHVVARDTVLPVLCCMVSFNSSKYASGLNRIIPSRNWIEPIKDGGIVLRNKHVPERFPVRVPWARRGDEVEV
jgi:hypothetical protein